MYKKKTKTKKTSRKIGVQFIRLLIVYTCAMINSNNMSFYKLLEGLGSVSFGWRQPVVSLLPSLHAKLTVHCRRGPIFTTQTQRRAQYSHESVCKEAGKLTRLSKCLPSLSWRFWRRIRFTLQLRGLPNPFRTGTGSPFSILSVAKTGFPHLPWLLSSVAFVSATVMIRHCYY